MSNWSIVLLSVYVKFLYIRSRQRLYLFVTDASLVLDFLFSIAERLQLHDLESCLDVAFCDFESTMLKSWTIPRMHSNQKYPRISFSCTLMIYDLWIDDGYRARGAWLKRYREIGTSVPLCRIMYTTLDRTMWLVMHSYASAYRRMCMLTLQPPLRYLQIVGLSWSCFARSYHWKCCFCTTYLRGKHEARRCSVAFHRVYYSLLVSFAPTTHRIAILVERRVLKAYSHLKSWIIFISYLLFVSW